MPKNLPKPNLDILREVHNFKSGSAFGRLTRDHSPNAHKVSTGGLQSENTPPTVNLSIRKKIKKRKPQSSPSTLVRYSPQGGEYHPSVTMMTPGGSSSGVYRRRNFERQLCFFTSEATAFDVRNAAQSKITKAVLDAFKGQRKKGGFPRETTALQIKSANIGFEHQVGAPAEIPQECCHIYAFMFGGADQKNPNQKNNLVIASKYFNSEGLGLEKIIQHMLNQEIVPFVILQAKLYMHPNTDVAKGMKLTVSLPLDEAEKDLLDLTFYFDAQAEHKPSREQVSYFYKKIVKRYLAEKEKYQTENQAAPGCSM